jgi:hypothetical protein
MFEPKLSDTQLQAKAEEMLINSLLGPADGPNEEINGRNVHDRYRISALAPRNGGKPVGTIQASAMAPTAGDDGTTGQDVPVTQALFPSFFGMTFYVDPTAKAILVEVSWGQYLQVKKEDRSGKPRVWRRQPRGGAVKISLKNGPVKPKALDPNCPDVFVQGQALTRDKHFIVTLFMVNGHEQGSPEDESFVFQPEVTVKSLDGSAIFRKRLQRRLQRRRWSNPATEIRFSFPSYVNLLPARSHSPISPFIRHSPGW